MCIRDRLGTNPLVGPNDDRFGPRFPDMTEVYSLRLRAIADAASRAAAVPVAHGVYVAVHGPSYETPAEIRYLRAIGADAVGMSTVPEAVAGVALGLSVLGVSCVTNVAGTSHGHRDVLRAAQGAARDLRDILKAVLEALPERPGAPVGSGA